MAVKEDVDICLNISGGNEVTKKQSTQINNDARVKRLKENDKSRKPFQKFKSSESSKGLVVGAKKRIKQKSLAAIVANNLKKVNVPSAAPDVSILKKPTKSDKLKKNKVLNKEKKVSFVQNKNNELSEVSVQFTKPSKENALKTILAKKRKIDADKPKKSLSNIFKTDSSETKLLKTQTDDLSGTKDRTSHSDTQIVDKKLENEKQQTEFMKPKISDTKTFEKESKFSNKFKKLKDKIEKNKNPNKDGKETNRRPSGKISSLFGHNPAVPNIGQRLVKPVNEKVFSAEKFSELGIHPFSVSNLEQNMKITTMTTVQKKAIPVILSNDEVLVRSQTGSGKTLAYSLPIIESLQSIRPKLSRNCGTKALVIVPTRELALQTYECFLKLIKPFTWIVPGYLVGGEKRKAEKARLRKGCTVLVATPGRLLDHIRHTKALKLDGVKFFVLDEADRMLDMGYEKDISQIVAALDNIPSEINNYGYDALKILKQHINPDASNETEEDKNNEENDSFEENNTVNKKQYNSDSDEDVNDETEEKKLEPDLKLNAQEENNEHNQSSDVNEPKKRKTILLSATLTHAVEKLAGLTMKNPIFIDAAKDNIEAAGGNLSDVNEDLVVPQSVVQSYIITPPKLRMVTLSALIAGKCQIHGNHKTLIFMATQDMVDYHTEILSSVLTKPINDEDEDSDPLVDVEFFKLHGNMTQKERTEVFKTFKQAKSGVLLCTDVAARGLDLPKVDTVVQYTGPTSTRDYVHRIGRTARAGSSGSAIIFLTPPEVEFVRHLESRRIRIKQDDMDDVLAKLLLPLSKQNSVHAAAIAVQNDFENLVLENKKFYAMACKAYTSWIRFYSSYPREMREFFNRKDLHLGHYAKSFALRDPPQKIGGFGKKIREKDEAQGSRPKHQNRLSNQRFEDAAKSREQGKRPQQQQQQDRRSGMLKKVRMLNMSEYDSGLEPIKKPKKS